MRGGFRFETWPGQTPIAGRMLTIDEAVAHACRESKASGLAIAVMDEEQSPPKLRGVAEAGGWRWASPCGPCKGTGAVPNAAMGHAPCGTCQGKGVRPDDTRRTVR